MKIVYATYVDNQKEINYPVKFILQEIPDMIVFASDQENRDYLQSQGVESRIIDQKIIAANDISIAQNKCIDEIFKTEDADFVVWVQADTYITPEGRHLINKFCISGNEDKSFALNLTHLRLFHICHTDYFGVTIFGKNETARFTGDGAHTPITGQNADARLGSNTASIDIGYLTIKQCRDHLAQHKKTWNSGDDLANLSNRTFIEQFLKRNDVMGMIQYNDIFHQLIVKLNLINDYNYVKIVAHNFSFSQYGRLTAI